VTKRPQKKTKQPSSFPRRRSPIFCFVACDREEGSERERAERGEHKGKERTRKEDEEERRNEKKERLGRKREKLSNERKKRISLTPRGIDRKSIAIWIDEHDTLRFHPHLQTQTEVRSMRMSTKGARECDIIEEKAATEGEHKKRAPSIFLFFRLSPTKRCLSTFLLLLFLSLSPSSIHSLTCPRAARRLVASIKFLRAIVSWLRYVFLCRKKRNRIEIEERRESEERERENHRKRRKIISSPLRLLRCREKKRASKTIASSPSPSLLRTADQTLEQGY